jgi:DNA-binding NarL/FixJ family response regulator
MASTDAKNFRSGATRAASSVSVVIFEANPAIRASLQAIVARSGELECLAAPENLAETLDVLRKFSPDVLLLDARLLAHGGTGLLADFRTASETTAILILTTFDLGSLTLSFIGGGAQGDLPKTAPPADLIQAVKWVKSGGSLMSVSLARRVLSHFPIVPQMAAQSSSLTPEEHSVVSALARGETYLNVAGERGLEVPVVLEMLREVCGKIQMEARVT